MQLGDMRRSHRGQMGERLTPAAGRGAAGGPARGASWQALPQGGRTLRPGGAEKLPAQATEVEGRRWGEPKSSPAKRRSGLPDAGRVAGPVQSMSGQVRSTHAS